MADVVIFDAGADYVGIFEDGTCWRWPAEADGWQRRRLCTAPAETDGYYELPTRNAHLALVLTGHPCGAPHE